MENIIDAIVIDTSVIEKYQFDFLGWTSKTLTSLYDLLSEKNINLLNHFILDNEIKKHIPKSAIIERTEGLEQTFRRNKDFFNIIGISAEEAIAKIKKLDLKHEMLKEYMKIYSKAKMLPFTEPEIVFKAYFNDEPPFSSVNDKKSEFPDAFIINAVKKYVNDNLGLNILVVSDDSDWQNAFESAERISVCASLDDAFLTIQNAERIMPIIIDNTEDILSAISFWADCEAYDISDFAIVDDIEIQNVITESIYDIIPLKILTSAVLFKCTANLKVNGRARIIDEDRSCYDNEDRTYYFISYSDIEFEDAEASVECEIALDFSSDDEGVSADVKSVKILSKYNIDLDLSDAKITTITCSEDDLALEALREDMGV